MKKITFTLFFFIALHFLGFFNNAVAQTVYGYNPLTSSKTDGNWGFTTGWSAMPNNSQYWADIQLPKKPNPVTAQPASCSFYLATYFGGTTLNYTFITPVDFTQNTLTIALSGDFSGKYAYIFLQDGPTSNQGGTTKLDLTTIVPIPNTSAGENVKQFSFDFSTVAGTCNLQQVTQINIMLYNESVGSTSPNNFTGNISISALQVLPKTAATTGVNTITSAQLSDEWALEPNGLMFTENAGGVLIGAKPSSVDKSLLFPYYHCSVLGRTNLISNTADNSNTLEIWSSNIINNKRQYLGFSNPKFSDNTEYSLINSGEYGGSYYNSKHLILQNNNGNVGIGSYTLAPLAKLSINGNVLVGDQTGISSAILTSNSFIVNGKAVFGLHTPTNHTDYKVAVEGLLVAQQFINTAPTNWSDFVFLPTYKIPTLKQQEEYIKENGHLKDIPSEQEVKEGGYDLSEIDAKLLQKIEELYLYTIELNKTVQEQKKEIEALKKNLCKE